MRKIVIVLSVLVIFQLLIILYISFDKKLLKFNTNTTPQPTQTMISDLKDKTIDSDVTEKNKVRTDGTMLGNLKSTIIEASNFKFVPDAIGVNAGDTVTVTFKNTQGLHDFTIDAFDVKSKVIKAGESEEITFVASKKGVFQFYCSIGQHKAMGMVGTLVVN